MELNFRCFFADRFRHQKVYLKTQRWKIEQKGGEHMNIEIIAKVLIGTGMVLDAISREVKEREKEKDKDKDKTR